MSGPARALGIEIREISGKLAHKARQGLRGPWGLKYVSQVKTMDIIRQGLRGPWGLKYMYRPVLTHPVGSGPARALGIEMIS